MRQAKQPLNRVPAECFPPGDFVREEMEARGWSAETLAEMIQWQRDLLDRVLEGSEPITEEMAKSLAHGFGVSSAYWLNLEIMYRRWLQRVRY
jgi:HTH-type transcriptional regulator/antitoxin HigA